MEDAAIDGSKLFRSLKPFAAPLTYFRKLNFPAFIYIIMSEKKRRKAFEEERAKLFSFLHLMCIFELQREIPFPFKKHKKKASSFSL
jgi:hypothetical protein